MPRIAVPGGCMPPIGCNGPPIGCILGATMEAGAKLSRGRVCDSLRRIDLTYDTFTDHLDHIDHPINLDGEAFARRFRLVCAPRDVRWPRTSGSTLLLSYLDVHLGVDLGAVAPAMQLRS